MPKRNYKKPPYIVSKEEAESIHAYLKKAAQAPHGIVIRVACENREYIRLCLQHPKGDDFVYNQLQDGSLWIKLR